MEPLTGNTSSKPRRTAFPKKRRLQDRYYLAPGAGGLLMDGNIKKGTVLSIEGQKARVAPTSNIELVSQSIQIAEYIDAAKLTKGSAVAYVIFEDQTGLIFAKLD